MNDRFGSHTALSTTLHERRVRRSCSVVDKAVWDPKRPFKVRVHTTAPVGPAAIAAAHGLPHVPYLLYIIW